MLCFFIITLTTFHGTKRCTSISIQIGKGGDQGNDRKAQTYPCQCSCTDFRDPPDVDPVNHVI